METSTRLHVALKALATLRRAASSAGDGDAGSR
jgi:hypothetical protein